MNTNNVLTPGSWDHVVGTYDGVNMRTYVNGLAVGAPINEVGTINAYASDVYFARYEHLDSSMYEGPLSDCRIYNRCLSPSEVYKLYDPRTRWDLYEPIQRPFLAMSPAAPEGRTTHNTDSHPLGVHTGMGWRYGNP